MTTIETTSHSPSNERELPSYDDVNAPMVFFVGVVSALLTLIAVMFVQGLYYHWSNEFRHQFNQPEVTPVEEQIARQKALLEGGDGRLSIEEAMKRVAEKY